MHAFHLWGSVISRMGRTKRRRSEDEESELETNWRFVDFEFRLSWGGDKIEAGFRREEEIGDDNIFIHTFLVFLLFFYYKSITKFEWKIVITVFSEFLPPICYYSTNQLFNYPQHKYEVIKLSRPFTCRQLTNMQKNMKKLWGLKQNHARKSGPWSMKGRLQITWPEKLATS